MERSRKGHGKIEELGELSSVLLLNSLPLPAVPQTRATNTSWGGTR
jgi:hypothetical protein